MSITIDPSRDSLFDTLGLQRLRESYMMERRNKPPRKVRLCLTSFLL
jgi:hypothetical protein